MAIFSIFALVYQAKMASGAKKPKKRPFLQPFLSHPSDQIDFDTSGIGVNYKKRPFLAIFGVFG